MWAAVYLLKRIVFFLLIVLTAATVNFFLPRLSGQDPIRERMIKQVQSGSAWGKGKEKMVEVYNAKFGLDKPLWQQYLTYLGDMARFDLGHSIAFYPKTVKDILREALLWTIGLLTMTTLLSFVFGTLFGALVAWTRAPLWLRSLAPPIMTMAAIPYYLLGLIMLFVFAFELRWFPGHGGYRIGTIPNVSWRFFLEALEHSILPALSILLSSLGFWAIAMRGMMVTVEGEDYMTLAEAKGIKSSRLFLDYGLRNAILPQITSLALAMGYVFSGALLVEVVFGFPGIGTVLFNSIKGVDYPVIQGIVLTIILTLATTTLILDLTLPMLDPRIRRQT
ncbi:MAG: ABC transporter permease [Caldilineaceae bacterium]|nr:ABC transporter permease [Caldilineaceae bacterium]